MSGEASIRVVDAEGGHALVQVKRLFRDYAAEFADSIGAVLCFQGFEAELAGLPGRYAPPSGCLLLAIDGDRAAGCVAMRDLGEGACEMKRLFVVPEYRGRGIGRLLVEALVRRAVQASYRRMLLDTVPEMGVALALYRAQGFVETPPYAGQELEGTICLQKTLEIR